MHHRRLLLCAAWLIGVLVAASAPAGAGAEEAVGQAVDPEARLTFERDIRPIVRAQCIDCHGGLEREANLDLRLRHFMEAGGESGAAIVPGKPEESLLVQRIESGEMPADEREVTAEELETLRQWIAEGAATARAEPKELDEGFRITPEDREHWAYQPIRRPAVPEVDDEGGRVRTPIDAFVLAAMAEQGLVISDDAEAAAQVRRVHFDLTGLPPEPERVERFAAAVEAGDEAGGAWQALIEELLASPHYGERWGRHWLDVAGYADSEGYAQADRARANAWRYRDYVIRSFNEDKPFDQFIREQLAGDELPGPIEGDLTEEQIEQLTATGFLRMAADGTAEGGVNQVEARNQTVADTIEIVATSLLGVTVQCAQCHDHHFDAIGQEDYYRIRAVFEPALDVSNWQRPPARRVSLYTQADRAEAERLEAKAEAVLAEKQETTERFIEELLTMLLEEKEIAEEEHATVREAYYTGRNDRTEEQEDLLRLYPRIRDLTPHRIYQYDQEMVEALEKYDERVAEIRSEKPPEYFLRALRERPGQVPTTYLFHRGNPEARGDAVAPGPLRVLGEGGEASAIAEDDPDRPTTGRRLAYAKWLTGGEHPLVARVLVNRVWMHYFGRGLVDTPDDFGTQGERPTHPELLDWLADEFMASGWSLKHIHRLIVSSSVYRQTSRPGAEDYRGSIDPVNRYYWHMPVRRLEGEAVRDALLAVSGRLSDTMYGPPVALARDEVGQIVVGREVPGVHGSFGSVEPLGDDDHRRSVYVQVRRTRPMTFLAVFDKPVMQTNCVRRDVSTDVNQALLMMNNEWVREQAHALADRVYDQVDEEDLAAQVEQVWRLALGRAPDGEEADAAVAFLEEQRGYLGSHPVRRTTALSNLCQVLLSSNAFLYID